MRSNKELREGIKDHSMDGTAKIRPMIRKADPDAFQEKRIREEIEINHQHGVYEGITYYE